MKKESIKLTLLLSGALLFNIIFWQEKLGVNALFFDVFIIASVFVLYPQSRKNKISIILALAHFITAAMVVLHNTALSKIAYSITLLLFVSFSQYLHRSVWYAAGSLFLNYVFAIPGFFRLAKNRSLKNPSAGISRPVRLVLIPLVLLCIFAIIYSLANKVFSSIAEKIVIAVQEWFADVFNWFSVPRFGFFLLGLFITAGLIIKASYNYFSDADLGKNDRLQRKKNSLKNWIKNPFSDLLSLITGKAATGMLAIKNENTIGLISLVLLNILLVFINILDIKYVWMGFTFSEDLSLSSYVHEGAGLLILSIILAMMVLLFFFRGNINFYKRNKWLRYGAYLWILQNIFLVISVVRRDYYYISHYGLAYKRIGLLFFLIMVGVGLFTVFIKIHYKRTAYYLLRVNAWAGIFLLVSASTVHWDYTIARYNISRKTAIPLDLPFLLSLSDKTLPLIEKNKDILVDTGTRWSNYEMDFSGKNAVEYFEIRKDAFMEEQKQYSWLSWNASDAWVKKELKDRRLTVLK
jgi:hypothetical protein